MRLVLDRDYAAPRLIEAGHFAMLSRLKAELAWTD